MLDSRKFDVKIMSSLDLIGKGERHKDLFHIYNYLVCYGYLSPDKPLSHTVLDKDLSAALATFQSRYNLEITGSFDQSTRENNG